MPSIYDFPKMSVAELEAFIKSSTIDTQGHTYALQLLYYKKLNELRKPHWSVTPSFLLLVLGTLAACVAVFLLLFPVPAKQSIAPAQSPSPPKAQSSIGSPTPHKQSALTVPLSLSTAKK